MEYQLSWPGEMVNKNNNDGYIWSHPGSNICLDFHGDPCNAEFTVFSDGNHHMALEESIQAFADKVGISGGVFYATTPPGVLVEVLKNKKMILGNLSLTLSPDVFISPPGVLDKIVENGYMKEYHAFARSQGNVFLIAKGNPKGIKSIEDLLRDEVSFFISNPHTEAASHNTYRQDLLQVAANSRVSESSVAELFDEAMGKTVFGERIHHREAPQSIAAKKADVAIVYYHLALRYTRIFPDLFDIVALDGSAISPAVSQSNPVCTTYFLGLIGEGGKWGKEFLQFMQSSLAHEIYARHGLTTP